MIGFHLFWNCGCKIVSKLVLIVSWCSCVWLFLLSVLGKSAFTLVMLFCAHCTFRVIGFFKTLVYSRCYANEVVASGPPPKMLCGPDEMWTWKLEQKLDGKKCFTGPWNQKCRQFLSVGVALFLLCGVLDRLDRWQQSLWPRSRLCTEMIIRGCHTKEVWAPQ